jgi:hypothetical protein
MDRTIKYYALIAITALVVGCIVAVVSIISDPKVIEARAKVSMQEQPQVMQAGDDDLYLSTDSEKNSPAVIITTIVIFVLVIGIFLFYGWVLISI